MTEVGRRDPIVLVADDDDAVRSLYATVLDRAGFRVVEARDGQEALDLLPGLDVGLILLDATMPRLDGLAVLRHLRETPATALIPVIMVTGSAAEEDRIRGLEYGADEYLTKPTPLRELVARVRAHIRTYEAWRDASESSVRELARSLAEAQAIAHLGSWERDLATDVVTWSDETCRIFGIEPGSFSGRLAAFKAFVHPDDRHLTAPPADAVAAVTPPAVDYRIVRTDGEIRTLHEVGTVIRDGDGTPRRYVGSVQDVTDRRRLEVERARLIAAMEQTADAILVESRDGTIEYANRAFQAIYGHDRETVIGRKTDLLESGHHNPAFWASVSSSVIARGTWKGEFTNRHKDGSELQIQGSIAGIRDEAGEVVSFVEVHRDVTRERSLEDAIKGEARFRQAIEESLGRIDPQSPPEAIAHEACVELGKQPGVEASWVIAFTDDGARLLASTVTLAGSPPAFLLTPTSMDYLKERAEAGPWVDDLQRFADEPAIGTGIPAARLRSAVFAPLRGSLGIVGVIGFATNEADDVSTTERLPALTTFAAVIGALIAPGLVDRNRQEEVRDRIRRIIDKQAFAMHFQPIVEIATGEIRGFEALTRFDDGSRPDLIFNAAAEAGLGQELEAVTLASAVSAARALPAGTFLSLNVTPDAVRSHAVVEALRGHDRPLVLEITEHVVIEDYAALRGALLGIGDDVELAVDDAGAGYASLRHILELSPRYVKLDIGLVRGIDSDQARQALVAGIGYFAIKRHMRLIAEGIETPAELATVRSLGVWSGQGYLLGRPRAVEPEQPWTSPVPVGGTA